MNRESWSGEPISVADGDYRPVFLVGMNGSGTTMLVDSLGRHPDLYAYRRETRIIPDLIASIGKYGELTTDENFLRLWQYVCSNLNTKHAIPVPSNWRDFPRNLAAVLDAVFRCYAAEEGKVRWCEKTPQHVQHMPGLHGLFPKAKFIHIIRDGRDCAASFNRRYLQTPEHSMYRWKNVVREGRQQGSRLGDHYVEVRYELITEKPEYYMRQICDFLGLPFHPDVLLSKQPQMEKAVSECEASSGLRPNSGKWQKYFTDREVARMEAIAGACLAELGYTVSHSAGDLMPSKTRLTYWKWRDHALGLIGLLGRDLRTHKKILWGKNFRRIVVALKQSRINRF